MANMSIREKIEVLLVREGKDKKISYSEIGRRLGITSQAAGVKIRKDNYTIRDLVTIADVLGYDVDIKFINRQTKEEL